MVINLLSFFSCLFVFSWAVDPPVYKDTYKAEGFIRLPYAEIVEPFRAYLDTPNARSRVDYYDGIQRTLQFSDAPGLPYGTNLKVIPFTTQSIYNQVSCFAVNGTSDNPATLTTIIPDLTGFSYLGQQWLEGRRVEAFQKVVTDGKKISTYTFWATSPDQIPVRYEMMGYDSLLGSHFDKYYVDYARWESPARFNDDDFAIPKNLTCQAFPGPGSEHVVLMNPIREYVHHQDDHIHEGFEIFKKAHKKQYKSDEHDSRKHVYRQNLRYIHSKNRAGLTYTLAVNHLADRTAKEMKTLRGYRYSHVEHGGKKFSMNEMNKQDVPDQWDWRLLGAVTPVKDQAICGSCWSFGTTGTIEGANFLKTGNLVRLSQQQLIDCSWGSGNNGCDGGEDFRAYSYIMQNGGLTSEEQYGQYLAIDGFCLSKLVKPVVQLANFTTLPQGDLSALKVAVFNKGPISVAIDASHKSLSFYANGVYYEPECRSDPDGLDHAVLAVGYGTLNGEDYWLVKNSWSTYWGNDGYVLMSQKNNNCGVATAATYVEIK
ncbi:digestive cysteine proteinase 2 [Biomphalaria pfeifferi]|uniref:Digestive cysteine proteinase 2 n=1 Tax=Biomphalaria pfeifferi TaxID=112525 RepID=A0AAD8AWZ3_BIOPF|nr:digestive cysteine proteinase 2 [Biomphalaria pfeifferi]